MSRLADLIEENQELLATIDAWDNGAHAVRYVFFFFFFTLN